MVSEQPLRRCNSSAAAMQVEWRAACNRTFVMVAWRRRRRSGARTISLTVKWQRSGASGTTQQRRWRNGAAVALAEQRSSDVGGTTQQRRSGVAQKWRRCSSGHRTTSSTVQRRCSDGEAGTKAGVQWKKKKRFGCCVGMLREEENRDGLRGCERIWGFFNPTKPYCLG